jgi:hypothetical protein
MIKLDGSWLIKSRDVYREFYAACNEGVRAYELNFQLKILPQDLISILN